VLGVNLVKDFLGGLRDMIGGRSGTYERELGTARDVAMAAMTEQARASAPTPSSASISTTRCWVRTTGC
jgi:uncharacterized protein YbjQ (UPF0145 family)